MQMLKGVESDYSQTELVKVMLELGKYSNSVKELQHFIHSSCTTTMTKLQSPS